MTPSSICARVLDIRPFSRYFTPSPNPLVLSAFSDPPSSQRSHIERLPLIHEACFERDSLPKRQTRVVCSKIPYNNHCCSTLLVGCSVRPAATRKDAPCTRRNLGHDSMSTSRISTGYNAACVCGGILAMGPRAEARARACVCVFMSNDVRSRSCRNILDGESSIVLQRCVTVMSLAKSAPYTSMAPHRGRGRAHMALELDNHATCAKAQPPPERSKYCLINPGTTADHVMLSVQTAPYELSTIGEDGCLNVYGRFSLGDAL